MHKLLSDIWKLKQSAGKDSIIGLLLTSTACESSSTKQSLKRTASDVIEGLLKLGGYTVSRGNLGTGGAPEPRA